MSSYATIGDFASYGLPSAAFGTLSPDAIQAALDAASNTVDGYIADKYTLPLKSPLPLSLVQTVCKLAQWELLAVRGFNPEDAVNQAVRMRYEDAISWCKDVSSRRTVIAGVVDSDIDGPGEPIVLQPQPGLGGFVAASARMRGY